MNFPTSFRSSRLDWQLRNQIAKFGANFGNSKQTSEPIRQKLSETLCNRSCITSDLSPCHQHVPGIFHGRKEALTNEEVVEVMASEESRHVYSSIQVRRVSCNVSFLISTESLSPSDAAIDAMGVWKLSKTKAKKCRGQMVRRRTYRNKTCKDLVKAVVEPEEQQFPYVFIQYRFEGEPCSFDLLPHGNSKTSQSPYVRVNPSSMQLLKEETDGVASAR